MPRPTGEHFGRYRIEGLLGKGGMGEVYRAWDETLERWVALKVLSFDDDLPAERLQREARAAAGLHHPNAIIIYDVGNVDGTPYLSMELVEGRTLRDAVGDPSTTTEQRIRWLREIASVL